MRPNGAMVLITLIQKYSLLVGSEESVLSIKIISQSFINLLWLSLKKKLMVIVLVGCSPICCIPLATFVVLPPDPKTINWGTYILNTTNLTWKKLNQAFAITIKRMVYLKNFHSHKTLKSVSLLYVALCFTSALPTTKCTFFPNKRVHFSSN